MARTLTAWALAAAIVAASIAAGCSGAGISATEARGGDIDALAADHLTAVVLVRSWLNALHTKPGEDDGCEQEYHSERLPGGSTRIWGTNSDCSTYEYTVLPDGSGQGALTLADGTAIAETWGIVVWDGNIATRDITKEFGDGFRLDYAWTGDYSRAWLTVTWEGDAILPDGRAAEFAVVQRGGDREEVTLDLPDGARCDFRVPLTLEGTDQFVPDYTRQITGHYVSAAGQRHDFTLDGWDGRWVTWQMAADGIAGEFTIGEDYAGDGQVSQDGRLAGALRWDADGAGVLELLLAGAAEVGPSGAALDFQIDRWIATVALLGPMPMY